MAEWPGLIVVGFCDKGFVFAATTAADVKYYRLQQ